MSSLTPSRVHITIYQDDIPPSRRNNKRLSDEMDVTPSRRLSTTRNRSPSQSRTPSNLLRTPGRPRTPLGNKANLTPYNPQKVLSSKTKSTIKDSRVTLKNSKSVTFSETYVENEVNSPSKRFKNESSQIVSVDSYKKRVEQLEAELRKQIDENQKQTEENRKTCQEAEKTLEKAKYMALSYKNELYGPVYVDGDYTSINKLLRHLAKVVGQDVINRFKEETLVDGELPALNQIVAWLEESGFLKYEVLKEFRAVKAVVSLDLTYTFEKIKCDVFSVNDRVETIEFQNLNQNMQYANRLVSVFGLPYGFQYLKSLKLSFMPIEDAYFNNLRGLKNLDELVINSTGIGNEALAHLVALKDNLCLLNITGNKKINDNSVFILVLFERLVVLLLDDTSISMDGIRKFVSKTTSTDLSQMSIPSSCRKYLNKRKEIYCVEHKQGMKVDPLETKFMSISEIRQQLMFHYRVNNNINVVGSKEELEESLKEILKRRRDDAKVMLLAGGRD